MFKSVTGDQYNVDYKPQPNSQMINHSDTSILI